MSSQRLRGVDESAALEEWYDLRQIERVLLVELARVEATGAPVFGKLLIEEADGRHLGVADSTGTDALATLEERGLINVGAMDQKTNQYELSDFGHQALEDTRDEIVTVMQQLEDE